MNLGQHLITFSLRVYKIALSPLLHFLCGPCAGCRYAPTCSVYALEAVAVHGVVRGGWLAVKRMCRCHPWGGCGDDPVPLHFKFQISNFKLPRHAPRLRSSHVEMQHAAHFGCPPPAR
jgi:putative membrane protein insertion efficiency factor